MTVASQYNGSYGTELFGKRAVDLILKHDQSKVSLLLLMNGIRYFSLCFHISGFILKL